MSLPQSSPACRFKLRTSEVGNETTSFSVFDLNCAASAAAPDFYPSLDTGQILLRHLLGSIMRPKPCQPLLVNILKPSRSSGCYYSNFSGDRNKQSAVRRSRLTVHSCPNSISSAPQLKRRNTSGRSIGERSTPNCERWWWRGGGWSVGLNGRLL